MNIVLCTQSVLRDLMDDDDNGMYHACWIPEMEDYDDKVHGHIYILQGLTLAKKWEALFHELHHMLTDLEGWDTELRQGGA